MATHDLSTCQKKKATTDLTKIIPFYIQVKDDQLKWFILKLSLRKIFCDIFLNVNYTMNQDRCNIIILIPENVFVCV